jgi:glycosyltransferase involved in cell wall biosynthesis
VSAPNKKVAIVCDWLLGTGGAERVVFELHKLYPEAPIYTSQYDPDPGLWHNGSWFQDADVHTGWLQKLPKRLKKFLPVLRARYFSQLQLAGYDLIISSSGAEAKFIRRKPGTLHIAYIHAPTHYYWSRYDEYLKHPGFGAFDWLARIGLKLLVGSMRRRDYQAAQGPDFLVTNSVHSQSEIQKYYDRQATVIHPPVDIESFKPLRKLNRSGLVVAGRQTPYKRLDLAVAACTELHLPLTVIGNGPQHKKLEALAGPTVTFVTDATDKDVVRYFQSAAGFIFPGLEDFGIVAVEALAAGTPVIAYRGGGAVDYIKDKKNGLLFEEQTVEGLITCLKSFQDVIWDHQTISQSAEQYASASFRQKIKTFVQAKLAD